MSDRSTENNSRNNAVDLPLRYFYPPRAARRIFLVRRKGSKDSSLVHIIYQYLFDFT